MRRKATWKRDGSATVYVIDGTFGWYALSSMYLFPPHTLWYAPR